ncbi:MAG: VWA domain-containing protein [Polyangiaceae bacterium]
MRTLSLLAPKGLWLLALLVPLIALYILKVRRKRLRVGSTWLWASAQRDLLAKSPFKKLVAQLSLILQMLALIALAFALARPAYQTREAPGSRTAIIIDVSASMGATSGDGQASRLERAKEVAKNIVDGLPATSEAMVVEAGRDARIVAPLDRDKRRLTFAIDDLSALEVEGDLGAALAIAVDRVKGFESAKVVVITDDNLAHPPTLAGIAVPVEVVEVGDVVDNAAIIRADARIGRDPKSGTEELQAFLSVANFGRTARELYVTMTRAGSSDVADSRRVTLEPGERTPILLSFRASSDDYRAGLTFEITPHDALAVDDYAYARVPAGDRLPVVLASQAANGASIWLSRALKADAALTLETATLDALAANAALDAGALVVVDGACPPETLPGGDLLVVNPPPGACFGVKIGDLIERPQLTSWENSDARLRFLTFDGVGVARARLLTPASASSSLVRTSAGTVVADATTASRTVTIVGFDVGDTDWPLKASFVLFMRNIAELARAHRASSVMGSAVTGEPLRVAVPIASTGATAETPKGKALDATLRDGVLVVPSVPEAGLYKVSYQGPQPGSLVVPVNLTSSAESDLSKRVALGGGPGVTVLTEGEAKLTFRDFAYWLALAALVLFAFEVWWYTRKPRANAAATSKLPIAPERRAR